MANETDFSNAMAQIKVCEQALDELWGKVTGDIQSLVWKGGARDELDGEIERLGKVKQSASEGLAAAIQLAGQRRDMCAAYREDVRLYNLAIQNGDPAPKPWRPDFCDPLPLSKAI